VAIQCRLLEFLTPPDVEFLTQQVHQAVVTDLEDIRRDRFTQCDSGAPRGAAGGLGIDLDADLDRSDSVDVA
jgi:hypothetical protein